MSTPPPIPPGFSLVQQPSVAAQTVVPPPIPEGYSLVQQEQLPDPQFRGRQAGYGANDTSFIPPLAEISAGANRSLMYIPDAAAMALTKSMSGYAGVLDVIAGKPYTDRTTSISDAIESLSGFRPGQRSSMEEGTAKDVLSAGGEVFVPGAMGLASVVGRNLARPVEAAAEFLGFGSAAPANLARSASTGEEFIPDDKVDPFDFMQMMQNKANKKVDTELAVKRGGGNVESVGFKLDPQGNVVKDAVQEKAIKIGLDRNIISQISQSSPADKDVIGQMLNIVRKGRQNKTFADFNLPRQVLGDSLYGRFQVIKEANTTAGKGVKAAKDDLKEMPFDTDEFTGGPVRDFLADLSGSGVTIADDLTPVFKGSDFDKAPNAQKIITDAVDAITTLEGKSMYDAHRLKSIIDEMAGEFSATTKGLGAKSDRIIKDLRYNVNQYIRRYSDDYANANDAYSETIDILNDTERLIGKRNTVGPAPLARTARSTLSNAQRSDELMQLIQNMDKTAKKYGGDFPDDLETQISVVQTIETLFSGTKPSASIGGEFTKGMKSTEDAIKTALNANGTTIPDLIIMGGKKAFGKSKDEQLDELLGVLNDLIKTDQ